MVAALALTASARAECPGFSHAIRSASNELATGTMAANKLAANKLAANKLAANKLSASSHPGDGTVAEVVAIDLPNGSRLSR